MKQRLDLQQKALEDGTLVPGQGMGMRGGYGHWDGVSGTQVPATTSTTPSESTT